MTIVKLLSKYKKYNMKRYSNNLVQHELNHAYLDQCYLSSPSDQMPPQTPWVFLSDVCVSPLADLSCRKGVASIFDYRTTL